MAKRTFRSWGLKSIPPFRGTPGSIDELVKVFVNREKELARAKYILSSGENILVRGMPGIGKTAFIMALLHNMGQEGDILGQRVMPVHIRQFEGGTRDDFYKVVLYALARRFSSQSKMAKDILIAVTGEKKTHTRSGGLSGEIEVGMSGLLAARGRGEIGREESSLFEVEHPEHHVEALLTAIVKKGYQRVIAAVDDLEKKSNQGDIIKMFESTLDLVRDNRISFVFTGRKLTILQDVYLSAPGLDVYNSEITLKPLHVPELRAIAVRTLNLVRQVPDLSSVHPFTDEVIEAIASKSFGIPRMFCLLCAATLRFAFFHDDERIPMEVFDQRFEEYQEEMAGWEVPPEVRRALYLGLQKGGFVIGKDTELGEVLHALGIDTIREFVDFAERLVQHDLLQRYLDERGETVYAVAPGAEKLAASGANLH